MSAPVVTVTQAHEAEARRIWDAGHDKIAGQAADASWLAQQAHLATLAEYIAATEAAFRAREAGLVEALERAAEVFDWLTENQPDCYGWHAPYPSVEPAIKLEADEIRAILARAKATSEAGEG